MRDDPEVDRLRQLGRWLDRHAAGCLARAGADLGYDQIQGRHLPPRDVAVATEPLLAVGADAIAESPLRRVRRLVEVAVCGGRRAIAEAARSERSWPTGPLRHAGLTAAALAFALPDESDRRGRHAFGRLTDPDPDRYAWAWLAVTAHLVASERELIRSFWDRFPSTECQEVCARDEA